MKEVLLQGKNLIKDFARGNQANKVLDDVTVSIYEKDFTVIMGPSGAGKSTLLYVLSGMDSTTKGEVLYKGQSLGQLKEKDMAALRAREFGFVFQDMYLVSNLSLYENVAVAGYIANKENATDVQAKTSEMLSQMGVQKAENRLPSQVSGGEAQRAAIARAMIGEPGLLFADEPTGALNKSNSIEVLKLLTKLNEDGQSILMVTHDMRAAIRGNRILYLEDGKVVDEIDLGIYEEATEQERERKLNEWLSGQHW